MIVAVANLKGGVAKTTTSVFLAEVAADRAGSARLVDADPQQSALGWSAAADEDGRPLRCVVVALGAKGLRRSLASVRAHPYVVIDTPPADLGIVEAAVDVADVVLIPCRATLMDLDRVQATLNVAGDAGKPAAVFLSSVRFGTRSLAAARKALDAAEVPLLTAVVPQREAIAAAYGTRPPPSSLHVYRQVLDELESALKTPTEGTRRGRSQ